MFKYILLNMILLVIRYFYDPFQRTTKSSVQGVIKIWSLQKFYILFSKGFSALTGKTENSPMKKHPIKFEK